MQFGMFDQLEHPGGGVGLHELYERRIAMVERAEAAGFWGYHKSEHHMIPLDAAPSLNVFLAAVAARTSRIRICSLVHLLPFYHPLRLAEELCMLDHLSNGRLEIGFGKGISIPEHLLWGLEPDEAVARTDEALDLILSVLQADGSFSYDGRFWQFRDVPIETTPFQRPYPPLWRPGTLDRAAELGVSTMAGGPIEAVAAAVERYRQHHQPGVGRHHPPRIGGIRKIYLAPTEREALDRARSAWVAYTEHLTRLFRRYELPVPNDPTLGGDFDRAVAVQAVVAGSPSMVRDHVDAFAEHSGTDYFVGGFAWGDLSADEVDRSLDLFAEHIVAPLAG
ncbi:MAG: LLM class flavin-dependent oxidoreductase [Actinomycetota bacterium]